MGLAEATDPEQWISQTNEANKKFLAGLAYSLDTPSVAEMPELAHQGMQRLLHQMLIRAGKTAELPDIPVPTAEQIASLPLEPHDMPVSPLFTLPAEQAATALPAVTEPYEEHERDEWIRVNAIFDGCPTKKQVKKLLQVVTDLNEQIDLAHWWDSNTNYPALAIIFTIEADYESPVSVRWSESYTSVGEIDDGYEPVEVCKPTPLLEALIPSWEDYDIETWQMHLTQALREAANTLNLPAPPPIDGFQDTALLDTADHNATDKQAVSPGDHELLELSHDPASPYTLRTNTDDSTTIFVRFEDTVFAIDVPTAVANQPHTGEPLTCYHSLCDNTSAFGDVDRETIFQFVVVPEEDANEQGTGDGSEVTDWWEDDGFYVEDTPLDDEFSMRHVNDEGDDGNPSEVRALRRMISPNGYVFVTMWTYPYNTPTTEQQSYDHSLTTMRIITP